MVVKLDKCGQAHIQVQIAGSGCDPWKSEIGFVVKLSSGCPVTQGFWSVSMHPYGDKGTAFWNGTTVVKERPAIRHAARRLLDDQIKWRIWIVETFSSVSVFRNDRVPFWFTFPKKISCNPANDQTFLGTSQIFVKLEFNWDIIPSSLWLLNKVLIHAVLKESWSIKLVF